MVEVSVCARKCLCVCVLLYLLFVSGKDVTLRSVTESIVLELAKGLENRGHNLSLTTITPAYLCSCNGLGSVPAGLCGATDGESPRK